MKKQVLLSFLALGLSVAAFAQSSVTTSTTKNVVLHEGTGTWCGWCVDGALRLENMTAADPRLIGLSVHDGDGMAFTDGDTYNTEYGTFYPYGTVDNVVQTADAEHKNSVSMSRGAWQTVVSAQEAKAAKYQLTMTHSYNTTNRTITITVTGKALVALSGTYNYNVYIVEDSVTGPNGAQFSQKNFYSNDPTYTSHPYYSLPAVLNGYVHRKVLRAMLGGTWGTTGATNPIANSITAKTFTYVLPTGVNMNRYKLIGLILKSNASSKTDREVLNTVQAKFVPSKLAVPSMVALDDICTYPNPATGNLRITGTFHSASDLNVSLNNSLGQTVLNKIVSYRGNSICDEMLDVSALSNGIYFLTVRTEEGQNTVRVMVSH